MTTPATGHVQAAQRAPGREQPSTMQPSSIWCPLLILLYILIFMNMIYISHIMKLHAAQHKPVTCHGNCRPCLYTVPLHIPALLHSCLIIVECERHQWKWLTRCCQVAFWLTVLVLQKVLIQKEKSGRPWSRLWKTRSNVGLPRERCQSPWQHHSQGSHRIGLPLEPSRLATNACNTLD